MRARSGRGALIGLTMASMILLAGCSGSDTGADSSDSTTATGAAESETAAADPVTTDQLSAAIGSITVGGAPLTVQTMPGAEFSADGFSFEGAGITPPECADTMPPQSGPGTDGDTVVATTAELPLTTITASADAADQVDVTIRPECTTIQLDSATVTYTVEDVGTAGDSTYAYTGTMDMPGLGQITTNSVIATYRGAAIVVNSSGAPNGTGSGAPITPPASVQDLAATVDDVIAALG